MKSKFQLAIMLIASTMFFTSCSTPAEKAEAVDMDKLKVEIQAMEDAFAAGEKAKDVDAVAAYYSDNATSFNRNEPPSVGMAAIKEKIAKNLAQDTTGEYNVYKVVDLYAAGDMAVEIGSWDKFDASGAKMENGYYMSYFEKRDGKYKCVRDMSVTESPAKSPM